MLSWQKFLEAKGCNIEDMEEKLGKDLDGDNEEDESKEHKKKVLNKKKKDEDKDE